MAQIAPEIQAKLVQRKPYLAHYFTKLSEKPQFSIAENPKEHRTKEAFPIPIIFYRKEIGFRTMALSSRYDPQREAEQILAIAKEKSKWKSSEIIFILGLGNLAVLPKVLSLLKAKQICIAIDAFLELGQVLCQQSPLMWEFLARPGSHLFCGPKLLQEGLQRYLESLPIDNFSGMQLLSHPPSRRLAPEFYGQTETLIRKLIQTRMSDLLTRLEFENLWIKNILLNSHYLPESSHPQASCYTVKNYEKVLKGIPGVLVASGPSLQESFAELKALKGKAFILCVDSALKVLLRAKIVPHAVISLDAQMHTYFSFRGLDLSEMIFFADIVSNPLVLRKVKAQKVIFSTTAQLKYDFEGQKQFECTAGTEFAQGIHGDIGYLQSGGSVATSAFDLLRVLACDPIVLVGLDQAYTQRKIHSSGSHHTDTWLANISRTQSLGTIIENIVRKRETFLVPAIQGGSILSDYVLNLYKRWFEDAIAHCSEKVYQITRQGALLESALTIKEPLDWIKKLSPHAGITDAFKEAPKLRYFSHPELTELITELQKTIQKTSQIEEINLAALYEQFPFLQFASRKAELYIKRNQDKLDPQRAESIVRTRSLEVLKKLERSLRHTMELKS